MVVAPQGNLACSASGVAEGLCERKKEGANGKVDDGGTQGTPAVEVPGPEQGSGSGIVPSA